MRTIPLLAALALTVAACGGSDKPTAPPPPVVYKSTTSIVAAGDANTFTPPVDTIAVGGTATWTFAARPHNVTFATAAGAPANVPTTTNGSASRTFASAGSFTYNCTVHPGMSGTLVVK